MLETEIESPTCDECGEELTTGMMALFCPRAEKCSMYLTLDEESQEWVREFRYD